MVANADGPACIGSTRPISVPQVVKVQAQVRLHAVTEMIQGMLGPSRSCPAQPLGPALAWSVPNTKLASCMDS